MNLQIRFIIDICATTTKANFDLFQKDQIGFSSSQSTFLDMTYLSTLYLAHVLKVSQVNLMVISKGKENRAGWNH